MERLLKFTFLCAVMLVTLVGVYEGTFAWTTYLGVPPEKLKADPVFNVVGPIAVGALVYAASYFTDKLATKLTQWLQENTE